MSYKEAEKKAKKARKAWSLVVDHVQRLDDAETLLQEVQTHLLVNGRVPLPDDLIYKIEAFYGRDDY